MADETPINRRRFFRQGMRELIGPLSRMLAPVERVIKQLDVLDKGPGAAPTKTHQQAPTLLRPPGAILEKQFLETCSKSGKCVSACPVHAIKLDPSGKVGGGAAYIEADQQACVVCNGQPCMSACPSGALKPVPIYDIDMGTAVWYEHLCVRTKGLACTICVDKCPVGSTAIELEGDQVKVNPAGCVGCGTCQQLCPTTPKSIVVIPKSARER